MIINRSGIIIRMAIGDLRIMGRATQGVRLINLKDSDSIAAVAKVEVYEEEGIEDLGDESEETNAPLEIDENDVESTAENDEN